MIYKCSLTIFSPIKLSQSHSDGGVAKYINLPIWKHTVIYIYIWIGGGSLNLISFLCPPSDRDFPQVEVLLSVWMTSCPEGMVLRIWRFWKRVGWELTLGHVGRQLGCLPQWQTVEVGVRPWCWEVELRQWFWEVGVWPWCWEVGVWPWCWEVGVWPWCWEI